MLCPVKFLLCGRVVFVIFPGTVFAGRTIPGCDFAAEFFGKFIVEDFNQIVIPDIAGFEIIEIGAVKDIPVICHVQTVKWRQARHH